MKQLIYCTWTWAFHIVFLFLRNAKGCQCSCITFYLCLPHSLECKMLRGEIYMLLSIYSTDSSVNWPQTTDSNLTTLFSQREHLAMNVKIINETDFSILQDTRISRLHTCKECVIKYLSYDLQSHRNQQILCWHHLIKLFLLLLFTSIGIIKVEF